MQIQAGLTPQLQGRSLEPTTKQVLIGQSNPQLGEIKEENNTKKAKNNLKGWI